MAQDISNRTGKIDLKKLGFPVLGSAVGVKNMELVPLYSSIKEGPERDEAIAALRKKVTSPTSGNLERDAAQYLLHYGLNTHIYSDEPFSR